MPAPELRAKLWSVSWRFWGALLLIVFLAINYQLVSGRAVPIWDARDSFFSFFVLVADHARAGRLVLWDPWSNGGLPRFADPEFGAFAPLQIVIGALWGGTTGGFTCYWLTIWGLGGVGLFMLARQWRVPPWGACVVAVGYLFSGVYTGHAEHISWLVGFSALPFVIWRLDVALTERRWLPAIQSGAMWGVAAASAYPGVTIVSGLFAALWTLGHLLCREQNGRKWRFGVPALVVWAIAGVVVLLPTYVNFFSEGAGVHSRTGALARDVAVANNALDPHALITLVSPFFQNLKYQQSLTLWPGTDVSSSGVYAGALVLTLALCAMVARPRDKWRWWLAGMTVVSLATALGPALPLRGWLYDWVYPTRFFRHASIFRMYGVFTLALLALIGVKDVAASFVAPGPMRRRLAAVMVLMAGIAAVSHRLAFPDDASSLNDVGLGLAHCVVVWGTVAAIALALWFAPRGVMWMPMVMVIVASGDAILTARLSQNTMFSVEPDDLAWWRAQNARHVAGIQLPTSRFVRTRWPCESNPPCRELNTWSMITKVPALDTYTPATNVFFDSMKTHPILSELGIGENRVWFASAVAVARPDASNFDAFIQRTEAISAAPLVVHPRQDMATASTTTSAVAFDENPISQLPAAQPLRVDIDRNGPNELSFSVSAPREGWLLVADRWARSWTATVNGRAASVYGGNFVYRAIKIPAGNDRVSFTYQPRNVFWLLFLSWGVLAVTTFASIRQRGRVAAER